MSSTRCKTTKELWDFQSSFLSNRCLELSDREALGSAPICFYNVAGLYTYLYNNALDYEQCRQGARELLGHIYNFNRVGDSFDFGKYHAEFTDHPYPRDIMGDEGDGRMYMLVKKPGDIPILHLAPVEHGNFPFAFGMFTSGDWPDLCDTWGYEPLQTAIEVWAGKDPKLGFLRGSRGTVVLVGEDEDGLPTDFSLEDYLRCKEFRREDPRFIDPKEYAKLTAGGGYPTIDVDREGGAKIPERYNLCNPSEWWY